jgi:flagellar protein FlaF
MAVADLIGAAVGVLLLVLVAYVLVGSTLSTAEIVSNAQKDLTLQNEARLHTDLIIYDPVLDGTNISCYMNNTGNEIIGDFQHMDILVKDASTNDYSLYTYVKDPAPYQAPGYWTIVDRGRDDIHPYLLDPGESYHINIVTSITPTWFQITTSNGVYSSAYL